MNEDILKGKWKEIRGRVKEKWGKLTDNNHIEIEGKGEILLGLLRKKFGYIRRKAEMEYRDGVELLEIISSIREIMTKKEGFIPFADIARYGQPLLAKRRESQTAVMEEKHGYNTHRYFDSRLGRRPACLASQ